MSTYREGVAARVATMTAARVHAIVASAYNLAAVQPDEAAQFLRRSHPNGMSPAAAAALPRAVQIGWLEHYIDVILGRGLERDPLYTAIDAQTAIDALRGVGGRRI